ncbi:MULTISPECIES: LysR family transcriptional regulator [Streptomyces]|uniref:LysR family transcriptional regulator n=2 Tax=Streptomyces TaxID=1883 RepID=A0AB39SIX5_9ACTN
MKTGARLASLDLNLLLVLDALLSERNVTRAGLRLSLTQPTVSAALGKLRRHFGDELLVRVGNRYELTPLANRLSDDVAAAVAAVGRVFGAEAEFDPATSDREFMLILSDYATAVLGEAISTALAERAPGVRLCFRPPVVEAAVRQVTETLSTVDGMVLPGDLLEDLPHLDLFDDTWVCVVARDNPAVGDVLTLPQLTELPWVLCYPHPTAGPSALGQFGRLGIEPRVQVVVGSYFGLAPMVAGSSRVALLQSRISTRISRLLDLRVLPCPFDPVPLKETLWWHPRYRDDPAHRWLRGLLADAASTLPPIAF